MGHINEPQGVDFIIESKPLTADDRAAISQYIKTYKAKQKTKQSSKTTTALKDKKTAA